VPKQAQLKVPMDDRYRFRRAEQSGCQRRFDAARMGSLPEDVHVIANQPVQTQVVYAR
jgi:hypothetical protein